MNERWYASLDSWKTTEPDYSRSGYCVHPCEKCGAEIEHETYDEDEDGRHLIRCEDFPLCWECRENDDDAAAK